MGKTSIYALLDTTRALDIWQEAGKEAVSTDPVVRGIIDKNLGHVCLATARPQDHVEERIIRVETEDLDRALAILPSLPGIAKVSRAFSTLAQS